MGLTSNCSPTNTNEALLARLRADRSYDAAVLRIGEADYGCEERPDNAPARVWLLLLTRDGIQVSREIPEILLELLHLEEGSLCKLADLNAQ